MSHEHVHLHAARDASAISATGTALHHVNSAISAVGGPLRRAKETLEGASQRQPHAAGDRQMSSVRDALDAHMRRFRGDAIKRDPSTGQFSSHGEAVDFHRERQAYHEKQAQQHGESSTSPYGSHGNAAAHHRSAAFYHGKAAENGDPQYEKDAERATKMALQASKKVASQGESYRTPEPRQGKVEREQPNAQTRRILRHLKGTRLGSRPRNIR